MSDKRQKNQLMLAFTDETRSEAPMVSARKGPKRLWRSAGQKAWLWANS
jgi:hypothetical protein